MSVSPLVNTTLALGIHQSDILIRTAIVEGIADLRRNPWLLDYCFASLAQDPLTNKTYGIKEIDAAKRWFSKTEIPVFMHTRVDQAQLPCISIALMESVEKDQTHGDVNYDVQEDTEADWPALTTPFTPKAYDSLTGNMTLPAEVIETLIPAPFMYAIDSNGRPFLVTDVLTSDAGETIIVLDAVNMPVDFRSVVIKGAKPKQITSLESVQMRESYSVGCHVQGTVPHLTYLHSILVFILLRYKQALLEARGFESSSISSSQLDRDRGTEQELAYARYLTITGTVRHTWPKNTTNRIEATNTGFTFGGANVVDGEVTQTAEGFDPDQDSLSFTQS